MAHNSRFSTTWCRHKSFLVKIYYWPRLWCHATKIQTAIVTPKHATADDPKHHVPVWTLLQRIPVWTLDEPKQTGHWPEINLVSCRRGPLFSPINFSCINTEASRIFFCNSSCLVQLINLKKRPFTFTFNKSLSAHQRYKYAISKWEVVGHYKQQYTTPFPLKCEWP